MRLNLVNKDKIKLDLVNKVNKVNKDKIKLDLVNKDKIKLDLVNKVNKDKIKLDLVNKDKIKLDLVNKDKIKLDLVNKDKIKLDLVNKVNKDKIKLDLVNKDKIKLDLVNKVNLVNKDKIKLDVVNKVNDDEIRLNLINNRINNEVCYKTINSLKDKNLLKEYLKTKSVKIKINNLKKLLIKYKINKNKRKLIINDYIYELIPPGTKSYIRGNKFNNIVKENIQKINLDNNRFEVCFEKQFNSNIISEIPDWYIFDKLNNKLLLGMNQLDFFKGGHQINRGSKYLINNIHNNNKSKLLCVIANKIQLKSINNKIFTLFKIGYNNNTLCYLNNINNIIKDYFNLF